MIEFFDVPPEQDAAFAAIWAAEATAGDTLHRALRTDVQPRFASMPSGPADGVLLIVTFDALATWDKALETFSGRQGFVGAWLPREDVGVVHWSSPLMYARTVGQEGEVLGFPSRAALYVRVMISSATH